jgi:cyclopropane fatty-acyl-phospholipid synthase-like methyltransferase
MLTSEKIYSDATYLTNNADWHLEDTPWKASEIQRILNRNSVAWETAVEVGCGSGGIVSQLATAFPDRKFVGYDIAKDAATFWPERKRPNLEFSNEDFIKSKKTTDLLMLIDVFEHVEDYMGFLRQLHGKSKWFVFHIPLDLHLQGLFRNQQMVAREKVGHLHYFSESTALATLRDTGFQVVDHFLTDVAFSANASHRAMRTRLLNPLRRMCAAVAPHKTALVLGGYSIMVLCRAK